MLVFDDTQTKEPVTEVGRDVKHRTDLPTVLIECGEEGEFESLLAFDEWLDALPR